MATVKEIFEKEGYTYDKDNRNYAHKSLQGLLDTGLISFTVCQAGMVWNKDGVKYNIKVSIKMPDGKFNVWYVLSKVNNKDASVVLKAIGGILQKPQVKEFMRSYVDIDHTCKKCEGRGIIPAFHYYCNGICFDCYGIGYNRKFRPVVQIAG